MAERWTYLDDYDGEARDTVLWRLERFERLGCDTLDARVLAVSDADTNEAERLVRVQRCPPRLLVELLA